MNLPSHKKQAPIYEGIKQALLDEIERGEFTLDQPFITYQEVCQRFNVSRITAERAINELVRSGVLTRKRGRGTYVMPSAQVSHDMSYSRDTKRTGHSIACVMTFLRSGHSLSIVHGIEVICRQEDCTFLLFDSGESSATEALNLQRAFKAGIDGLIIYPVDGYENAARLEQLRAAGIPIVMLDRYYPTIPTDVIVPDNVGAGYQITSHLIEKGHQHIATAWSEVNCTSVLERLIGYKQALQEKHLMIETSFGSLRPYYTLGDDERRSLLQSWLTAPHPPTAIIAAHDLVLQRLTMDLLTLGVKVGEDIVLASMDSPNPATLLATAEVAVTLPSEAMGEQAARLLLRHHDELMQGIQELSPQHHTLPVHLTIPHSIIVSLRGAARTSANDSTPPPAPAAATGTLFDVLTETPA